MNGTLMIRLKDIIEPQQQYVAPSEANEKTVTGGAGAWENGSYTEIIAADSVTSVMRLTSIEVVSVTGIHQIDLAIGAAASEVVVASVAVATTGQKHINAAEIVGGSRVAARTRTKAGGAQAATIFLHYETRS